MQVALRTFSRVGPSLGKRGPCALLYRYCLNSELETDL